MLRARIQQLADEAGARAVAVGFYDYQTDLAWSLHGARVFHAASTVKVAVLLALFDAIDRGVLPPDAVLAVRNRFLSVATGEPFRTAEDRDASPEVYAAIGRLMPVRELARHMIQTSSNLATNLLVDLLGVDAIRETLHRHDVAGVEVRRGVEDEAAWAIGLNNTTTADGLVRLFRVIQEGALSEASTAAMREILLGQRFRSGIPGGLPEEVRDGAGVAHKTGEISTVAHDAGLVFLPDRRPYALALLTEWEPGAAAETRRATLAALSRAVYETLVAESADAAA